MLDRKSAKNQLLSREAPDRVRLRFRGYCDGWLSQGRDGGSIDPCERRAMDREHLMQRMRERADVATRRLGASASGSLLNLQDVERAIYAECDRLKAELLQAWADEAKEEIGRAHV